MRRFLTDESGQGMVEYGLIIALVAVAAIAALKVLGPAINDIFQGATDEIKGSAEG